MKATEILEELRPLGLDSYKKVIMKHGAKEPLFGVKIEELKKIQKRIKMDYQLAKDLFDTGNYDAMYLAGLIADDAKMKKADLQNWAENANCTGIREYTVAWVAAESPHGWEAALEWIKSEKEEIASIGWATLSSFISIKDDADLDIDELRGLLKRIPTEIHAKPDRTRYTMNGFVIALGSYVKDLSDEAIEASKKIGTVFVDMGGTACKVPDAAAYIEKVAKRGAIGKKKKTAKC
jgi:hypothetical protein